MDSIKVERLLINFKTLEDFQDFREYGIQELSMKEDLEGNIIENDSESPFYGIYFGNKLVARMSLYLIEGKFDRYFEPRQDYLELWKLEVLEPYRSKGFGTALVNHAKSFNLPIKTNARQRSSHFWEKMGFEAITYQEQRDRGENPYVWFPEGVKEQKKD
ncbi:N-acetyltransferase [Desertibacillus haloalkaliphilus]|uniref:N-acetyltransferase n=1 Tax=Desertibacillus haloalkaliphilus TaxID=1328930 RepID=UPI001C25599B|nr:N-acetyltransferase [Desertibacillus haloalkaliphilus]MBU8907124.1 N-acetyltransferase [Desertibacillus haloalkaliphilus]